MSSITEDEEKNSNRNSIDTNQKISNKNSLKKDILSSDQTQKNEDQKDLKQKDQNKNKESIYEDYVQNFLNDYTRPLVKDAILGYINESFSRDKEL